MQIGRRRINRYQASGQTTTSRTDTTRPVLFLRAVSATRPLHPRCALHPSRNSKPWVKKFQPCRKCMRRRSTLSIVFMYSFNASSPMKSSSSSTESSIGPALRPRASSTGARWKASNPPTRPREKISPSYYMYQRLTSVIEGFTIINKTPRQTSCRIPFHIPSHLATRFCCKDRRIHKRKCIIQICLKSQQQCKKLYTHAFVHPYIPFFRNSHLSIKRL